MSLRKRDADDDEVKESGKGGPEDEEDQIARLQTPVRPTFCRPVLHQNRAKEFEFEFID